MFNVIFMCWEKDLHSSFIIASDDFGSKIAGIDGLHGGQNEAGIIQTIDGTLYVQGFFFVFIANKIWRDYFIGSDQ